jgi:hypothetical protein
MPEATPPEDKITQLLALPEAHLTDERREALESGDIDKILQQCPYLREIGAAAAANVVEQAVISEQQPKRLSALEALAQKKAELASLKNTHAAVVIEPSQSTYKKPLLKEYEQVVNEKQDEIISVVSVAAEINEQIIISVHEESHVSPAALEIVESAKTVTEVKPAETRQYIVNDEFDRKVAEIAVNDSSEEHLPIELKKVNMPSDITGEALPTELNVSTAEPIDGKANEQIEESFDLPVAATDDFVEDFNIVEKLQVNTIEPTILWGDLPAVLQVTEVAPEPAEVAETVVEIVSIIEELEPEEQLKITEQFHDALKLVPQLEQQDVPEELLEKCHEILKILELPETPERIQQIISLVILIAGKSSEIPDTLQLRNKQGTYEYLLQQAKQIANFGVTKHTLIGRLALQLHAA